MFNLKSALKIDPNDNTEPINNQLFNHVISSRIYGKQKKFTIKGTKISDSFNTNSTEFLNIKNNEHSTKATEILTNILSNNLNTFNQLINYNYKTKIKNHEDMIKNNRLNFLLGLRRNEKIFSIRPASLNDLNERLNKTYNKNISSSHTKIIYNLSKKYVPKKHQQQIKFDLDSESTESLKKITGFEVLKKLALVDFDEEDKL
jgi:hypothetical protein